MLATLLNSGKNSEPMCSAPVIIFSIFPFYSFLLKIWLGSQFNQEILYLIKIFSLSVIFSCCSHILITKFEASKILKQNIKFESYLLIDIFAYIFYNNVK